MLNEVFRGELPWCLQFTFRSFSQKDHVGIHYASFASFLKVYKFWKLKKLENAEISFFKHILFVERYLGLEHLKRVFSVEAVNSMVLGLSLQRWIYLIF